MSSVEDLRDFVRQRLTAAAAEIFSVFEQTVVRYEEEIDRQRRLLEITRKPGIKSPTAGTPQQHGREERRRWDQGTSCGVQVKEEQEDPGAPQVKQEPDDACGALPAVKLEPDTLMVTVTGGESDHGEAEADDRRLSSHPSVRRLIDRRLAAVAVEILTVVEQTVERYQDGDHGGRRDVDWKPAGTEGAGVRWEPIRGTERSEPERHRVHTDWWILNTLRGRCTAVSEQDSQSYTAPSGVTVPCMITASIGSPPPHVYGEAPLCDVETSSGPDQEEVQSFQIKEEEVWTSDDGEAFMLKEEPDAFLVTPSDEHESNQVDERLISIGCGGATGGDYAIPESSRPAALMTGDQLSFVVVSASPSSDAHVDSPQKTFQCETCGKAFSRIQQLRKHRRIHTGEKPHCCQTCGKRFIQKQNLKTHMKTHTGEKPFTCEACGKSFSQKGHLKSHMNIHTGEKPYFCETCGKHFRHKISFLIHMRNHTGEKPFLCNTCGTAFTNSAALKKHTIIHTGELFSCEMCSKTFRIQRNLMVHMKTHSDVKSFFCETCGKGFSRQGNLLAHMRTHTGEKPHHCEICGKTFSRHSNLLVHMRTHTGAKPHTCDTCGKSFSQQSSLAAHKRIHTGEKPYSCEICGRGFTEHGNMLVHRRTHTGEKPYCCAVCRKRFSQQTSLSAHMKTHTGEKLQS